jgi:S1-C subfamily serine protease
MKKAASIIFFIFIIILSGCSIESAESLYDKNKDSVLEITSCPFTYKYAEFTVTGYVPTWGGDWVEIIVAPKNHPFYTYEEYEVEPLPWGSGFVSDGHVITNSHVVTCDDSIEDHIKYNLILINNDLIENMEPGQTGYRSDYVNYEFLNPLISVDIDKEANVIFEKVKQTYPETVWTFENIKDKITLEIVIHLLDYGEVVISDTNTFFATSPRDKNKKLELSLITKGEEYPGDDYAILEFVEEQNFNSLNLLPFDEVNIGDKIFIMGYPLSSELTPYSVSDPEITEGQVSSMDYSENVEYIVADITSSGGSSGGPVFDEQGRVIGLLTAGSEDFEFILPIWIVRPELEKV